MRDPGNLKVLQDGILRELSRASLSVDILVDFAPCSEFAASIMEGVIWHASASQLRLRCLLQTLPRDIEAEHQTPFSSGAYSGILAQSGRWEVKVAESEAVNFIILDREVAFSLRDFGTHSTGHNYRNVRELRSMFDYLWREGMEPQVLYYARVDQDRNLIVNAEESWTYIINLLAQQPSEIYSLPPRKFEELIAELLARAGLEVEVTPSTRDGGRDILALADSICGNTAVQERRVVSAKGS